jgi:hypothetical protein
MHIDNFEFWVGLCKDDALVKKECKALLKLYVKNSRRRKLTLGPEESVIEQEVKTCRALNSFWKALIAAADAEYLYPKRKCDSATLHWMVLKRPKNYPGWADK